MHCIKIKSPANFFMEWKKRFCRWIYIFSISSYAVGITMTKSETTHEGVDVNKTHLSMINPDYNIMLAISVCINQYSAY